MLFVIITEEVGRLLNLKEVTLFFSDPRNDQTLKIQTNGIYQPLIIDEMNTYISEIRAPLFLYKL